MPSVIKLQKYVQSFDPARWAYQYRGQDVQFSAFVRGNEGVGAVFDGVVVYH